MQIRKRSFVRSTMCQLLVPSLLLATAATASAQELHGARAYALGGAYVAVTDDITALYWNPAGIAQGRFNLGAAAGGSYPELTQAFQAFSQTPPTWEGDLRLHVSSLAGMSVGGFAVGAQVYGEATGQRTSDTEFWARGEALGSGGVTWATAIAQPPLNLGALWIGTSVRALFGESFSAEGTPIPGGWRHVTEEGHGRGYALDLGTQLKVTDAITVGFSARNAVARLDWERRRTTREYTDASGTPSSETKALWQESTSLPLELRAGVAIRPPLLGLTLAADLTNSGTIHYGVEKSLLFGMLALRVGQMHRPDGDPVTTAGLGLNVGPVQAHVAAGTTDMQQVNTIVQASIRF